MSFFKRSQTTQTDWIALNSEDQIDKIISDSEQRPQIIYKHSTLCPVSAQAYRRLKLVDADVSQSADIYYLDVIAARPVSNAVAERFRIQHESPQILLIRNGRLVWDESHYGIQGDAILEALQTVSNQEQ